MAAALYASRADPAANIVPSFSPAMIAELDYGDERYPSISSTGSRSNQRSSVLGFGSGGRSSFSPVNDDTMMRSGIPASQMSANASTGGVRPGTSDSQIRPGTSDSLRRPASRATATDTQSVQSSSRTQPQDSSRSAVSYSLPVSTARRVVERYSLDGTAEQLPSKGAGNTGGTAKDEEKAVEEGLESTPQLSPPRALPVEPVAALPPSAPRHPSLPAAGIGTNPTNVNADYVPPIMPLSASPTYAPPISSRQRAYPQQPTYITQGLPVQPIDPIFSNGPPPQQEEVCIECAMRDQDMADVDVASPGVWDRESDVLYQELVEREAEEAEAGIIRSEDHSQPTSKGDFLTERNLKVWLTLNPKEPAARQQTLRSYLKSQRALLEAEAVAHSRALHEAKQLDGKMRDAYSKLRSSAYDTGTSASFVDDSGAVRIKAPQSPVPWSSHTRRPSRDVTLLENGMIVEHVDVRREEKQAKDRRRKEERQMRKSSRSSAIDVTSLASTPTLSPLSDSGFKPSSTYSVNTYGRPVSVLTAPLDGRPSLPRAQSQASLDMYSLSSASPRRSRFFGTFADRWRSQDSLAPSGMSGSMMDMHLALQKEEAQAQSPIDLSTPRRSQLWNVTDLHLTESRQSRASEDKRTKKKKVLAKIWQLVTSKKSGKRGSGQEDQPWPDKIEDNSPLAPPPPLPFLMNHRMNGGRHSSTPSLPTSSARIGVSSPGMSPPTAPSSILPSPSSSRPSGHEVDIVGIRKNSDDQELGNEDDTIGKKNNITHTIGTDWDARRSPSSSSPPPNGSISPPPTLPKITREKSLPPLPGETPSPPPDPRPRTVFGTSVVPLKDSLPPGAGYRSMDVRRQSFNGLVGRPNVASMFGMPTQEAVNGYGYNNPYEFGASRHSLQLYDQQSSTPTTKRKSKFGFASLLGKKSTPAKEAHVSHQFPVMNAYNDLDDSLPNDYAPINPRYSGYNTGSRSSRKMLEEKVPQDPEFVAYRYPSENQNLDLLR